MLRKHIKLLISAIRKHDNEKVEALLSNYPELISATAKSPPKKDDGQSPLQIAFKVGNFEVANSLINLGADTDFIEVSELNEWRAPVLHDAIRATIFSCAVLKQDTISFESGKSLLSKCIDNGANPNKEDSYGNTCLMRSVLDARQMITHPKFEANKDDTIKQLREVFSILIEHGADPDQSSELRPSVSAKLETFGLGHFKLI